MVNPRFRTKLLEIVENQLKENNPPCTGETLNRLMKMGKTEEESKLLIAGILVEEMYDIMKNKVPFNESRYAEKLANLTS
ncbi:MAG: hypothetical protein ACQEXB_13740 [Bacillota bacterium]